MESKHDIQIEELYLPAKDARPDYLCEDFIIYPEDKEKEGGYVFGIIELRATPTEQSRKIIQAIVNTIKENYYQQIISSPEPHKLNLETVFEHALQRANDQLTDMVNIGHIKFALENLHYAIATAKPNGIAKEIDVYFTQQGLMQVFLLHKTKQNNYKVIDVMANTPRFRDDSNSQIKFFSSTLAGKIFSHDTLYICSEIFSNYIPAHKANKMASESELPAAVDYFKSLINNVRGHSHLTYSAIFVKLEEKKSPSDKPVSARSIDRLLATTENTERYLTPNFSLNIKGGLGKILDKLHRSPSNKRLGAPANQPRIHFSAIKYGANIIKIIFGVIITFFVRLYEVVTGKRKFSLSFFKKSANLAKDICGKSGQKFNKLPRFNRRVLIIIAVLIVVLGGSILWLRNRQASAKEETAYNASLQQLQEQINNAQVNLIYQNNDQSILFVQAAEKALTTLPQKNNSQKANYAEMNKQITTLKNKLLHIDKVVPQLVAEILNESQPINLKQLRNAGNKLFATADNGTVAYLIDASSKDITPAQSTAGAIVGSLQDSGNLFALTDQGTALKLDLATNSFSGQTGSIVTGANIIANIYNGNIYALDKSSQSINKYSGTAGGFNATQIWLKDKGTADLGSAVDFALDGNLYVLTGDARVYKFFSGKPATFTLGVIEPAMSSPAKIFTNLDVANIYLLDSASKRIIITDKTGKVLQQYLFDTVSDPIRDFSVDEKAHIIYFISGNKIYQAGIK
ncbi:MAG: hypothetical protein V1763_02435 [Parcubacteria group bacterium]